MKKEAYKQGDHMIVLSHDVILNATEIEQQPKLRHPNDSTKDKQKNWEKKP